MQEGRPVYVAGISLDVAGENVNKLEGSNGIMKVTIVGQP